jgi:hypothetical protein
MGSAAAPNATTTTITLPSPNQNRPMPFGNATRRARKYSRNPLRLVSISRVSAATV